METKHVIKTWGKPQHLMAVAGIMLGLVACANPHNIDRQLKNLPPETKVTSFSQAVMDLGMMSEIYGTPKLHVMAKDIIDNTGSSLATQAEIPRDVTEMLKSTLNSIGGNVVYIPFDPDFIINAANTGYSGFDQKLIPNVVVTGGITEFDRGLEQRGRNTDVSLEGTVDKKEVGFEFGGQEKDSLSSITLDFNLIDFNTFAGIPRMQAINTIKVDKVLAEDSIGFSINGNSIGLKGTVKKVQGRHAAVRLLVQLSMIQVVGKHLKLPYWNLLPGAEPDPVVLNQVTADFYQMDEASRWMKVQELLILNGYEIALTGAPDQATQNALKEFAAKHADANEDLTKETYIALYSSVPITFESLRKRKLMGSVEQLQLTGTDSPVGNIAISEDGQLRIWTESSTLRIGEKVKIFLEVSTPLYVRLYSVDSAGEIAELFPNDFQQSSLLTPGNNYQVPPADEPFTLDVTGPVGQDKIFAFASPRPIPNDLKLLTDNGGYSPEAMQSVPTRLAVNVEIVQ